MGKWVWVLRFLFWDEKGSRQGYWILTKKEEALDDLLGKLRFGIVCCLTTRKELCKLCVLGWEGFTSRLLDFNKERGRWRSFGWLLGKLGFGLACCLTTRKELHKLCVLGFNIIMLGYFIYSLIINTDFGSCFFLFGEWGFWSWESRKLVVMRAYSFIGGWLIKI